MRPASTGSRRRGTSPRSSSSRRSTSCAQDRFGVGDRPRAARRRRAHRQPVILSTGMSTIDEIDRAIEALGTDRLVLMHATSSYPMPAEEANLRMIDTLAALPRRADRLFGPRARPADLARRVALGAVAWSATSRSTGRCGAATRPPRSSRGFERLVRDIRILRRPRRRGEGRLPGRGGAAGQAAPGACVSGTLLVVADTDSYVKWGAALASQLPTDAWRMRLVVLATPAQPSARQLRVALAGSRFVPADVDVVELDALGELVGGLGPEAVLLALRGPLVRVVAPVIGASADRPVLVERLPRPHDPGRAEGRDLPGAGRPHRAAQPTRGAGVPRERRTPRRARSTSGSRRCRSCGPRFGSTPGRRRGRRAGAVGAPPRHPARRDSTPAAPTSCSPRRRRSRRSARTGCASSGGSRMPHAGVRSAGSS